MNTDFYEVLGVGRNATDDELKRAYRKKARQFHPDANGGDPANEERFKEVSLAYEVLRDPERRARYDRFGPEGVMGTGGGGFGPQADGFGGLGDLFDAFFSGMSGAPGGGRARRRGPTPGPDAEVALELEFREAVFGAHRQLTVDMPTVCETCAGAGTSPGTTVVSCAECQGTGEVRRVRQSILGQVVTAAPCPRCQGTGESIPSPCPTCRGEGRHRVQRTLTIDVPAGVDEGSTLRLPGHGPAGVRGGPNGTLYVHLAVAADPRFERSGADLHTVVHVSMTQAALGASIQVATLDEEREVTVAPGTQSGEVVRLKGLGVPLLRGRGRGDLFVHLTVDTPVDLDREQRELLVKLAELRHEPLAPAAHGDGLLSKLRSALG